MTAGAAQTTIAICVDDVGLAEGAADASVHLAAQGRINAASCVTTTSRWPSDAAIVQTAMARFATARAAIRRRDDGLDLASESMTAVERRSPSPIELGLHFNLTEGRPLSQRLAARWPTFPNLPWLMASAHAGRLPLDALNDEWQAQVDAFTAAIGAEPTFVDGHQHVHALPGVRNVVIDGVRRFTRTPAVRNTGRIAGPGFAFKRWTIERSGGRALERALDDAGIAHNRVLVGVYDFGDRDYRSLFVEWLTAAHEGGALVFCHPSMADRVAAAGDPIATARRREAAYLAGDDFANDLAAAGVTLGAAWGEQSSIGG